MRVGFLKDLVIFFLLWGRHQGQCTFFFSHKVCFADEKYARTFERILCLRNFFECARHSMYLFFLVFVVFLIHDCLMLGFLFYL